MAEARKSADHLVTNFLRSGHGAFAPGALHRKSVRSGGATHEAAIIAWEARVRHLAHRSPPTQPFDRDAIDDRWLVDLVALTLDPEGPVRAVDHLRRIGIVLVTERHLPGIYLDSAPMCARDGSGLIALTLRHDRLDNFWFTLFHEIRHLKLHIGRGEAFAAIFDDIESPAGTVHEEEADLFAQEALLPMASCDLAVSRCRRRRSLC